MPFRIPARLFDAVVRKLGYVPAAEMAAALADKEKLEGELRHKNSNLRHQIYLRDRLEKEVEFLRQLELAHANRESGIQRACARIDTIADNLLDYMKSVWPDAHGVEDRPTGVTPDAA